MSGVSPTDQPHDRRPDQPPRTVQPSHTAQPSHTVQPQYAPQPQYVQQPQYAQPQYAQPQYVQPVYYGQPVYAAAAPPRGKSITSMVLGLVSVFFGFVLVLPLIGFIIGLTALKSEPAGRGMAITGIILNGLMLLGWVIAVVFIVLAIMGLSAASIGTGISA